MATVYFDLPNVTNGTGTSASPKNQTGWNAYSPAAGDILLFKRGTVSASTAFALTAGTAGNVITWGAWYNADGTDDSAQPRPILTCSAGLSTYASPKDYTAITDVEFAATGLSVANDKSFIFCGTGTTLTRIVVDTNVGAVGIWGKSNVTVNGCLLLGVSHSSANNNCVLIVSDSPNNDSIAITNNVIKHYGGGSSTSHCVRCENSSGGANALTNLTVYGNTITTTTGVANANVSAIGLYLSRCPSADIRSNTITFMLEGIFMIGGGAATAATFRFNNCNFNAHFGIHLSTDAIGCTIDQNVCSNNGTSTYDGTTLFAYGRGIECSGAAGQARCSGHTIRFNTCNNNYNYGGSLDNGSEGVGIGLDDATSGCTVYGNTCKNNEGNGVQYYGNTLGTGSPAITDTGGNNVIANYFENNCTAAITNRRTGGTNTNLFNAHISVATTIGTTSYIAHNVFIGSTPCAISINALSDDLIVANNIITSARGIAMASSYSASIGVCNSNDFFGVTQKYCLTSTDASGSATFASATFVGTNNLTLDPLWTSDYHLSTGSTAAGAGFAIGTQLDFAGRTFNNPPSLGMYEFFSTDSTMRAPPGGYLRRLLGRRR